MPDDDKMQIMDLATARAMSEPRTPVEVAADPAHGGGQVQFGQGQAATFTNPQGQSGQMSSLAQQTVDPPPAPYVPTPDDVVTFAGQVAGGANGIAAQLAQRAVDATQPGALGVDDSPLRHLAPKGGAGAIGVTGAVGTLGLIGGDADKPRTILSGLGRLRDAIKRAEATVGDLEALVADIAGEAAGSAAQAEDFAGSTLAQVHTAADAIEAVFGRVSDLVAQARAAHG